MIKEIIKRHPMFAETEGKTENSHSYESWGKCKSDYEFLQKLNYTLFHVLTDVKGWLDIEAHNEILRVNKIK